MMVNQADCLTALTSVTHNFESLKKLLFTVHSDLKAGNERKARDGREEAGDCAASRSVKAFQFDDIGW